MEQDMPGGEDGGQLASAGACALCNVVCDRKSTNDNN